MPKRRKRERRSVLPIVLLCVGIVPFLGTVVTVLILVSGRGSRDKVTDPTTSTGVPGTTRPRGPELLVNGSFEDGPEPDAGGPGFTPLEAGSTVIRGWTVTRGSIDYIGPYWQHADGKRSIDLNGNEPGAIAQTFRTTSGKKYRVTFSLAGNMCEGSTLKAVAVHAAGQRAEFTFDAAGRSYENMGWLSKTWEFTANAAETTLEFESATPDPPACGPALDKVSVVEV